MANKARISIYLILFIFTACRQNSIPVGDTSQNSLDWQGTYQGIIPCADCSGILTMIQLKDDNTFVMSTRYLGKDETGQKKSGSFTWDRAGSKITLRGLDATTKPVYKVGENKLIPMDITGSPATGARAGQYVLTKHDNDITNKYWKLTNVNSKKVIPDQNQRKEPHIILHSTDSTVTGNGGCNNFRGTYKLSADNRVSIPPMAVTKMACMKNMEVEDQLLKALSEASSYNVSGDSLFLFNDRREKSATFAVVYLR